MARPVIWSEKQRAHYQAYFDLYKAIDQEATLVLYVQSAYMKSEPHSMQRQHKVSFGRICAELLGVLPHKRKGRQSEKKERKTKAAMT